ncbi:hypothetical protein G2W53_027304 [Senna tora]|uniref:Uncharacterized protein n=1 Tax=Senna tora TaxID=362788 RepID=A0A834TQL9_9FABA|nr:hypothetical protein G2W53_027304 [Senna tora]
MNKGVFRSSKEISGTEMSTPLTMRKEDKQKHLLHHEQRRVDGAAKPKNVQVKTFNASGIRSYYNLPRVNECRYEELKDDDKNFPWIEIEVELGAYWDPQEGSKRYILRSDMNATARIWLILVASNIKPSKYLTKISRKTALLLYLLKTNQPVKLEAIIYKSLCKVAYNGRAGCALIFPHMISDFYCNAGILEDDTDAKFKPKHQLDYKRVGKGRVDPDDPCTSEVQAHPTAEASAQPYDRELLLSILSNQERILRDHDYFIEQLHHINERLDSYPHPMDIDVPQGTIRLDPAASGATMPIHLDEFGDES